MYLQTVKLGKFQTVLPLQIRKSLNLHEGDVLIWEPTEKGEDAFGLFQVTLNI